MSNQQRHTRVKPAAQPDTLSPATAPARAAPSSAAPAIELLQHLTGYGEAVAAIAAALALSPERLARAEALDRLELETDLPLAAFDTWDTPAITRWFAVLGPDLRIDASLTGGTSQFSGATASLRAGRDPARAFVNLLDTAQQAARDSGDDITVSLRLAITKTQATDTSAALLALRPEYLATPEMLAHTKIAVFYSAAAFHRLLSMRALADWERLSLAREDGRAVVVLCDRTGYLAGVALEVLGARQDTEPRWLTLSRAGYRQFRQRAEQTRALRDEEGSWATAPHVLTPAHLRVASRAPGLEDTAARLIHLQSALSAAYLADSVHTGTRNDLTLRFAGPRPATCHIPAESATAISPLSTAVGALPATPARPYGTSDIPAESATGSYNSLPPVPESRIPAESATAPGEVALTRLCAWAYDNASPDKLAIARECLARELPHAAGMSLSAVEAAAPGALEAAKANFTLYLRRNTEQYFTIRQKALDAVTDYAAAVRKAVSDLTGEVVDNVYRTVGVLVGVVIAALIQPSLSLGVARLAAFLYTAYIALVVLFFMRARWRRFELEKAGLDQHLAAMQELGPTECAALRRQPTDAEAYFAAYFHRARWLYIGLGVAGLLLFLLLWTPLAPLTGLPHSPIPTPTPTHTPGH